VCWNVLHNTVLQRFAHVIGLAPCIHIADAHRATVPFQSTLACRADHYNNGVKAF
jgi:hypothetical protein